MKSIIKFFRKISDLINKLPLAGKLWLRPALHAVYRADYTTKKYKAVLAYGLLTLFIFAHGFQAILGYELFQKDINLGVNIIGASYGIVNALVTYTQIVLIIRLSNHLRKFYESEKYRNVRIKKMPEYKNYILEVITPIVVTLGGQILFMTFA